MGLCSPAGSGCASQHPWPPHALSALHSFSLLFPGELPPRLVSGGKSAPEPRPPPATRTPSPRPWRGLLCSCGASLGRSLGRSGACSSFSRPPPSSTCGVGHPQLEGDSGEGLGTGASPPRWCARQALWEHRCGLSSQRPGIVSRANTDVNISSL